MTTAPRSSELAAQANVRYGAAQRPTVQVAIWVDAWLLYRLKDTNCSSQTGPVAQPDRTAVS